MNKTIELNVTNNMGEYIYTYNENHKLISVSNKKTMEPILETEYNEYDKISHIASYYVTGRNEEKVRVKEELKLEYNIHGDLIKTINTLNDIEYKYTIDREYDEQGRLVKLNDFSGNAVDIQYGVHEDVYIQDVYVLGTRTILGNKTTVVRNIKDEDGNVIKSKVKTPRSVLIMNNTYKDGFKDSSSIEVHYLNTNLESKKVDISYTNNLPTNITIYDEDSNVINTITREYVTEGTVSSKDSISTVFDKNNNLLKIDAGDKDVVGTTGLHSYNTEISGYTEDMKNINPLNDVNGYGDILDTISAISIRNVVFKEYDVYDLIGLPTFIGIYV